MPAPFSPGLEGVVAAQTEISEVDGQNGRLIYRGGYLIRELAERSFEEVAYLLWHGELPQPGQLEELKRQLADHGLNASTFTARVAASTGTDLYSAMIAAIGALKGPAHGGAATAAMKMLDKIGTADNAERWLTEAMARKDRIMGFGHRVY